MCILLYLSKPTTFFNYLWLQIQSFFLNCMVGHMCKTQIRQIRLPDILSRNSHRKLMTGLSSTKMFALVIINYEVAYKDLSSHSFSFFTGKKPFKNVRSVSKLLLMLWNWKDFHVSMHSLM